MKQKSLFKNAIWNFLYSGINVIFPLITAPYISRVLGAENLGLVDFSKSFVLWFVTFAAFGTTTYGVRAVAQVRENPEKLNKTFSEIFTINLMFSIVSLFIYFGVIFNLDMFASQKPLFIAMSLSIVLNAFNIDWFYQGIEEYSYITIRNAIVKILSLVAIFILITHKEDYVIYGLISVLGTSLSGILNLINSRKYVKLNLKINNLSVHMKSLFMFYLITFVITIYTNLDKTILGLIDSNSSVAYMTRVITITSAASTIAVSITNVAMPRASYYLKNDKKKYENLVKIVPNIMLMLTIPISFGVFYLSRDFMLFLGGDEFVRAHTLLKVVSIVIVFSTLSTFLQQQVIVPSNNEKFGLKASIISSVVSLGTNLMLIPKYSYLGAGIAQVLSQFTAFLTRYIFAKRNGFEYITIFNESTGKYLIASILMYLPINMVSRIHYNLFLSITLKVLVGFVTYFMTLLLLKEDNVVDILNKIRKRYIKRGIK